jgi:hypothetical protein
MFINKPNDEEEAQDLEQRRRLQWWRNLPSVGIDDWKMRPVALSFEG